MLASSFFTPASPLVAAGRAIGAVAGPRLLAAVPRRTLPNLNFSRASRGYLTRTGPPKVCTAEEAVQCVQSFNRVYLHGVAAQPEILTHALAKRTELRGVEVMHLHLERPNPCAAPELKDSFFVNNLFIGHNMREAVDSGRSSYIPMFLSEIPVAMRQGYLRPDVAFVTVSPPDKHGYVSLGTEVTCALAACETAPIIVAVINKHMPRTHGQAFIHFDALDYVVYHDSPLPEKKGGKLRGVDNAIGKLIAGLVPDGATLQMGIGGIPDAVLASLTNHKDLGIHTEMFQEGLLPLVEKGVVTNLHKRFLPGRIVTTFLMGSQKIYDFVDDNPVVNFMDAAIANHPAVIAQNPKVIAINAAVEIDLTGQVCADSIGQTMISGVGGQVDFERGAALSPGGIPIICVPSTTSDGQSRIVPILKPGAGVVTTRYHVHFIVTEWGYAQVFGKNLIQRAKALINIAHPDHREALEKAAFERLSIKSWE
ncbi:4-hydroxybutyrate CoA-transferase [Gonapodya prolifera JEL478]|uniref:4-hydroxybutyrate CoA-transferase n=1 Tax=Gonapodya prolifera (strain JEL478) TaxID=1344416 RepID=A0A139AF71_GONPJ|nr:4-hydroxybutyrate CoA-transferase [Gonapodya prolifera JEL478]|eukprot:KXS15075.1 4-hydroxybutyrate CoA-transferase [Gonapodya prolifera JEL478]